MNVVTVRSESSASSDLLSRVRDCNAIAWQRFTALYSPWVYSLSRRAGLSETDAADIGQEVFLVAATRIDGFRRTQPGESMKCWLGQIARNKIGDWMRAQSQIPIPIGGDHELIDAANAYALWATQQDDDFPDDAPILQRAIELVKCDFSQATWVCFRRTVLEGESPKVVAEDLGMTAKAVRQAKFRVLSRLRGEFEGLIDWDSAPLDSRVAASM